MPNKSKIKIKDKTYKSDDEDNDGHQDIPGD